MEVALRQMEWRLFWGQNLGIWLLMGVQEREKEGSVMSDAHSDGDPGRRGSGRKG